MGRPIQPGQIRRSTLQEKLTAQGYSTRPMRLYAESGVAARRFQQRHRNRLWHSDLKYGPYLPIGVDGAMKQVFLVTFIDHATRFVLHGTFYPVMDKSIVEDCFRQAIQKFGFDVTLNEGAGKIFWLNEELGATREEFERLTLEEYESNISEQSQVKE